MRAPTVFRTGVLAIVLATSCAPSLAAVGRTPTAFDVSPTGEAAYTVPIRVPSGIRGLAPQLALSYSHRGGGSNAWLGTGWGVSGLSAITRCPKTWAQDGQSTTVKLDMTDRFCLDGQQLKLYSGTYGADGAEYRTEIESFSRIKSVGVAGSGPASFTVERKDGSIAEYGTRADSRIEAVGTSTPHTWAIATVRDRSNNRIEFNYTEDTALGSFQIANIAYTTNPTQGVTTAPYTVNFTYETQPTTEVQSGYIGGSFVKDVKRMTRIDVNYNGTTLLRRYTIAYEGTLSSASRSRIASVAECAGASGTDCLPATTFSYQNGTSAFNGSVATPNSAIPNTRSIVMDVNGDGRSDLVYPSTLTQGAGTWMIAFANSSGGYNTAINSGISNAMHYYAVPIDYNADGLADLLVPMNNSTWWIIQGTTSGFAAPIDTGISAVGAIDVRAVDFDGDGLDDLVWNADTQLLGRVRVWGGTFSSTVTTLFTQPASGQGIDFVDDGSHRNYGSSPDFNGDGLGDLLFSYSTVAPMGGQVDTTKALFSGSSTTYVVADEIVAKAITGDFNGDGLSDIAYPGFGVNQWAYRFGTGKDLTTAVYGASWVGQAVQNAVATDWDGDGYTDILVPGTDGIWKVMRSSGEGFYNPASTGLTVGSLDSAFLVDSNGDGLADVLTVAASTGQVSLLTHQGIMPDLLATATDGFGNGVTFNYTTLSMYSGYYNTNGLGLGFPYTLYMGAMSVVSSSVQSDGNGGNYTVTRNYYGAMVQRQGRGFVGFWATNAMDSRDGTWRYVYFEQAFPKTGQVYQSDAVQPNNATVISRTQSTWTYFPLGAGVESRYVPYTSTSTTTKYEVGGTYDGNLLSTTVTTNVAPDSTSGEIYDSTTTTTESATANGISQGQSWTSRTYVTSLLNDTSNWCLGRPSQVQQTSSHTMTGGTAQTRTTSTSWDVVNCRPYQTIVEPNSTLAVTTGIQYDGFGNPTIQTVTGYGMTVRTTTTGWSSDGRFPTSVTNALGQTTTASFYQDTGLPYQATDPNGLTTTLYYDNLGRKSQETRPDGTYSVNYYNQCDSTNSYCWTGFTTVRMRTDRWDYSTTGVLVNASLVYTDMQDRVRWQYDRLNRSGNWEGTYRYIDAFGRTTSETLRFSATSTGSRDYLYDLLGRVTRIRTFNAAGSLMNQMTTAYNGLSTVITDHYNKNKTTIANAIGQTRQSFDHNGYYQLFQFDAFGNPTQVSDGNGKTLQSAVFNVRGMRTQSTDADMGTWNYYYNALGEPTSQTDAKNQSVVFTYDLLGRPLTKSEPGPNGGSILTSWTYGTSAASKNIGRTTQAKIDGVGNVTTFIEDYYFDGYGRPSQSRINDGSTTHYIDSSYNSTTGLLDSVTYPVSTSGYRHQVVYEYQYGFLSKVRDSGNTVAYWTFNAEDPNGAITQETLGNGLKTTRSIEGSTGLVNSIQTGPGGGSSIQNLNYTWDSMGSLLTRGDANQGVTETFGYDNLYRLTSAQVSGQTAQTVTYATNGNILTKSDVGTYTYDATKIHAVTGVSGGPLGTVSYAYDANGNVTSRGSSAVTWYANNKPKSIQGNGESSSFEYGPSGQYWKQVASYNNNTSTETTKYIGGLLEIVTTTLNGGLTSYRHHIQANGRTVAIVNRGSNGANNTVYPLTDHLGGVESITDSAGAIIVKENFDPWGKRRGSNWAGLPSSGDLTNIANSTRRGYTGHTMLDNIGLVHMNGRVYDPVLGRFLSADPYIQFPDDTQSWNRYAYVFNNPLSYVDPSGYFSLGRFLRNIGRFIVNTLAPIIASFICGPQAPTCARIFTALISNVGNRALDPRRGRPGSGPSSNPFGGAGTSCNWGGAGCRGGPRSIGGFIILSATSNDREESVDDVGFCRGESSVVCAGRIAIPGYSTALNALEACRAGSIALCALWGVASIVEVSLTVATVGVYSEAAAVVRGGLIAGRVVRSVPSVWTLDPFQRGRIIETALGANLPSNFPTVDRVANGIATSIKSIDLQAATYQSLSALRGRLNGYVDSLASFSGAKQGGFTVGSQLPRELVLAVPPGAIPAGQLGVIQAAIQRANSMGIAFSVVIFP